MYDHRLWVNQLTLMEFATRAAAANRHFSQGAGGLRVETEDLKVPPDLPSHWAAHSLPGLSRHQLQKRAAAQTL